MGQFECSHVSLLIIIHKHASSVVQLAAKPQSHWMSGSWNLACYCFLLPSMLLPMLLVVVLTAAVMLLLSLLLSLVFSPLVLLANFLQHLAILPDNPYIQSCRLNGYWRRENRHKLQRLQPTILLGYKINVEDNNRLCSVSLWDCIAHTLPDALSFC